MNKRGYSLVEISLLLAVVGIILGGSVLRDVGSAVRNSAYDSVDEQLADAIDAVAGYAATNRSQGFLVGYGTLAGLGEDYHAAPVPSNDLSTSFNRNKTFYGLQYTWVPENRPYLPCPDIDNDGVEDRRTASPARGSEFPIGIQNVDERPLYFFTRYLLSNDSGLSDFGECEAFSGSLPWRSLGIAQTDPWGNQFTYIVHPNFSTATFGFDQNTRADFFPVFSMPDITDPRSASVSALAGNGALGRGPLFVCDYTILPPSSTRAAPCASQDVSSFTGRSGGFFTANDVSPLTGSPNFIVNRYASLIDDASTLRRTARATFHTKFSSASFSAYTDGLPFVIISHGQNGAGARNVAAGSCNANSYDVDEFDTHPEAANFLYGACSSAISTDPRDFRPPSTSGHQAVGTGSDISKRPWLIPIIGSGTNRAGFDDFFGVVYAAGRSGQRGFNQRTISFAEADAGDFDDVVGWLTRRELIDRLYKATIFPVREYPNVLIEGVPDCVGCIDKVLALEVTTAVTYPASVCPATVNVTVGGVAAQKPSFCP